MGSAREKDITGLHSRNVLKPINSEIQVDLMLINSSFLETIHQNEGKLYHWSKLRVAVVGLLDMVLCLQG